MNDPGGGLAPQSLLELLVALFIKQSPPSILCQRKKLALNIFTPYSEVTESFCRVPSTGLSQGLSVLHLSTCVGLRYGFK